MDTILINDGAPLETIELLWSHDESADAAPPHMNMIDDLPEPSLACLAHFNPLWRAHYPDGSTASFPALAPLQRRFEIIAQSNPAARAVACNGRVLTYGELNTQADELALQLQRDGLAPGSFCLLQMEPSLAFTRAVLAVLKAGAACLQVDPALTTAGIGSVMAILKPALLFVHARDQAGWGDAAMRTVRCDEEAASLPFGYPDEIAVDDDTPAHVFATVSSRGGLCVKVRTHKALAARSGAGGDAGPLAAADPAPFWRSLSAGALLTIAPHP